MTFWLRLSLDIKPLWPSNDVFDRNLRGMKGKKRNNRERNGWKGDKSGGRRMEVTKESRGVRKGKTSFLSIISVILGASSLHVWRVRILTSFKCLSTMD